MKSGFKTEKKKKELKKLHQKEKASNRSVKDLRKKPRVDTDFHHVHPFREQ